MKSIMKSIQCIRGIRTKIYTGALGHIYYINDFLGLISQEMANLYVRPYLHFIPEISKDVTAAYQAQKWLSEMDPALLTPMVQHAGQEFYIFKPALVIIYLKERKLAPLEPKLGY